MKTDKTKDDAAALTETTVSVTRGQLAKLRGIAGREYLKNPAHPAGKPSVSAVVRRALEAYLEAQA